MWPKAFKDAAFDLKEPGDISDPVDAGDGVHLIQLIAHIPPAVAKFEDHRELLRTELEDLVVSFKAKQLRDEIDTQAAESLQIHDQLLFQQFQEQKARVRGETTTDPEHIKRDLEMSRPQGPETRPANPRRPEDPEAQPPGAGRPPATRPAP
jgi:hypothetical protein